MLTSISIQNLAVVESLDLDLSTGMTALTGETGAGKSILIDALGLALGNKSDKNMIRHGSPKAEITAVFDVHENTEVLEWLSSRELEADGECQLRRIVTRENRNKAFINGSPATLKLMQELGNLLVEIHGQHAHQRLLKNSFQLDSVDLYAGHQALLQQTSSAYESWQKCLNEINLLKQNEQDRVSRLELLRFQHQELEQLNLQANEIEQLESDFKTLTNADQLIQGCFNISSGLYEADQSVHTQLSSLRHDLGDLVKLQPELQEAYELLDSALININECSDSLRNFSDSLESDEQALHQVEQRLQTIFDIARKYRVEPELLVDRSLNIEQELSELENADQALETLQSELEARQNLFEKLSEQLHTSRKAAAARLTKETVKLLQSLAMPEVRFAIEIEKRPLDKANKKGLDQAEFKVSANPGQPLGALKNVASGGELSRISLAIQVAAMSNLQVATLIFDEVDVGIGGGTAEIVGNLLRRLGNNQQVLCVTHLPQVAAQAHHQLSVTKSQSKDATVTEIRALPEDERVREIGRMLGGVKLTDQTLNHAREMLENTEN